MKTDSTHRPDVNIWRDTLPIIGRGVDLDGDAVASIRTIDRLLLGVASGPQAYKILTEAILVASIVGMEHPRAVALLAKYQKPACYIATCIWDTYGARNIVVHNG